MRLCRKKTARQRAVFSRFSDVVTPLALAQQPVGFLCHRGSRPLADALEDRQHRTPPFGQRVLHPGRDLVVGPPLHQAVVDDETLLVSAVFLKTTLKNIAENGQVAVSAFAPTPNGMFEGYQVIGTARYVDEGGLFDLGKSLVGQKPLPYHGALVIKVEDGTVTSPGPNVGKSFENVQW